MPIYFTLSIYRVLLSGGVRADTQNLLQKGRTFIMCGFGPILTCTVSAFTRIVRAAQLLRYAAWGYTRLFKLANFIVLQQSPVVGVAAHSLISIPLILRECEATAGA
jgi:hypothetical protein